MNLLSNAASIVIAIAAVLTFYTALLHLTRRHTGRSYIFRLIRDLLVGLQTLHGKLVINCGGPWADILLNIARGNEESQHIRRSEGIHIVTRKITNANTAVGGLTPTGRPCNLIPWRNHTLIGTTDREYIGDPDKYSVTREKIEEYIA